MSFYNEFLQSALNRRGIEFEIDGSCNNNICDFLLKSVNGMLSEKRDDPTVKTDIAIINGKVYYQKTPILTTNVLSREVAMFFKI